MAFAHANEKFATVMNNLIENSTPKRKKSTEEDYRQKRYLFGQTIFAQIKVDQKGETGHHRICKDTF